MSHSIILNLRLAIDVLVFNTEEFDFRNRGATKKEEKNTKTERKCGKLSAVGVEDEKLLIHINNHDCFFFEVKRGNLKICDKLEIFKVYLRYEKSCNDENL